MIMALIIPSKEIDAEQVCADLFSQDFDSDIDLIHTLKVRGIKDYELLELSELKGVSRPKEDFITFVNISGWHKKA